MMATTASVMAMLRLLFIKAPGDQVLAAPCDTLDIGGQRQSGVEAEPVEITVNSLDSHSGFGGSRQRFQVLAAR